MCWHYPVPENSRRGAAPGGTQARRPCTGRHCAFSSRAQTPSFRVTQPTAPGKTQVHSPSGAAGCGAGDKLLCPLFISASGMPPVSPSNQITAWPRTFSFLSCPRSPVLLLSLVRLLKVSVWMNVMRTCQTMDSIHWAEEVFAASGSQQAEVTWAVLKWLVMPPKSRSWKEQGLLLLSTLMSSDNASATQSLSELSLHFNRKGCYFFPNA